MLFKANIICIFKSALRLTPLFCMPLHHNLLFALSHFINRFRWFYERQRLLPLRLILNSIVNEAFVLSTQNLFLLVCVCVHSKNLQHNSYAIAVAFHYHNIFVVHEIQCAVHLNVSVSSSSQKYLFACLFWFLFVCLFSHSLRSFLKMNSTIETMNSFRRFSLLRHNQTG